MLGPLIGLLVVAVVDDTFSPTGLRRMRHLVQGLFSLRLLLQFRISSLERMAGTFLVGIT